MARKRRQFSREFKIDLVQQLESGMSASELARQHGFHMNLLHKWRKLYRQYGEQAFQGNGKLYRDDARIAQLERTVGQLCAECRDNVADLVGFDPPTFRETTLQYLNSPRILSRIVRV